MAFFKNMKKVEGSWVLRGKEGVAIGKSMYEAMLSYVANVYNPALSFSISRVENDRVRLKGRYEKDGRVSSFALLLTKEKGSLPLQQKYQGRTYYYEDGRWGKSRV